MTKLFNTLGMLLLIAWVSSCSDHMSDMKMPQTNTASIIVQMPYAEVLQTSRTIPVGNAIKTLDIMAFDESGKYLYSSASEPLYSIDGGNSYLYTIHIKDKDKAAKQSFVFIANMEDKVQEVCTGAEGKSKTEIINALVFENRNWSDGKTGLPMWSETSKAYDVTAKAGILDKVKLVRAVAAVEVLVNGDLTEVHGLDNFKLSDIILKDSESKGFVAPLTGNYTWTDNKYTISSPSVPQESTASSEYQVSENSPVNSITGKLFIPEFSAEGKNRYPSLLIGGYYGKGNTTEKTWYKVNLMKGGKPISVLRNTKYVLNITSVSAKGFPTEGEAYANESQNLKATLTLDYENTSGLNNVVYDASNFIAASTAEVTLNGTSASLELLTNADGGWTFESVPDWIKVSASSGAKDQRTSITLSSLQGTGELRSGMLVAVAGRLKLEINVIEKESNEIIYTTTTVQQIINAQNLNITTSEFILGGGTGFHDKYMYIGNSYYKKENGKFAKRPQLIVYDTETEQVVKVIEEWQFNGKTLNFEGTMEWPDAINDIVADPVDNRLYVMRRHHAVEVFDISNPAEPKYVTRMGQLMDGWKDNAIHFYHSSAVGTCQRAVLVRARKVLNTYERNTILPESFENIQCKTTDNKNMLDLGEFIPRQFAQDGTSEDKIWLTEYGNASFKGVYRIDVSSMNLSSEFYLYRDMREKQVPLDYNPTGMAIKDGYAYITQENGTIDIINMNKLNSLASRSTDTATETTVKPAVRSVVKNYTFGKMSKLYPGKEEDTFWSCDSKNNNLVLMKVGKGIIITE